MIDPDNVPDVGDDEVLARDILYRSHVRQDQTIKPDAFIPHPYPEWSVTRHLNATDAEIWQIGQEVAETIRKPLQGRADINAAACINQGLQVIAAPLINETTCNPNHTDVIGWPKDKPQQKLIAQILSLEAKFSTR